MTRGYVAEWALVSFALGTGAAALRRAVPAERWPELIDAVVDGNLEADLYPEFVNNVALNSTAWISALDYAGRRLSRYYVRIPYTVRRTRVERLTAAINRNIDCVGLLALHNLITVAGVRGHVAVAPEVFERQRGDDDEAFWHRVTAALAAHQQPHGVSPEEFAGSVVDAAAATSDRAASLTIEALASYRPDHVGGVEALARIEALTRQSRSSVWAATHTALNGLLSLRMSDLHYAAVLADLRLPQSVALNK